MNQIEVEEVQMHLVKIMEMKEEHLNLRSNLDKEETRNRQEIKDSLRDN